MNEICAVIKKINLSPLLYAINAYKHLSSGVEKVWSTIRESIQRNEGIEKKAETTTNMQAYEFNEQLRLGEK